MNKYDDKESKFVVETEVLVMKNPCNHPGDIRRCKAVNREELDHLVNVVVFSRKGQRPEQNKMSGGDLDGDVYMVIWDEDLVKDFKDSPPAVNSHKTDSD